MKFPEAFNLMKTCCEAVKLPEWRGFWYWSNGTIMMKCHDGHNIDIRATDDIGFTLGNVARDDWEIATVDNCPALKDEFDFDFAEAIRYLKQGRRVCRKGWNGKGQYIELATGISYKTTGQDVVNAEHNDIGNQAIAFVGTSGVQIGWLASQADMLAKDWTFARPAAHPPVCCAGTANVPSVG